MRCIGSHFFVGLFWLLAGSLLLAQAALAEEPVMSTGRSFVEQGGAALYANVCAGCHQPDGKGAVGAASYPALAQNGRLASRDYMLTTLLDGLRSMPPVGQMMSDAQVADVINYVRMHFGNDYGDTVSIADVAAARARLPR
jgi:mono/diheme cytochrome c family protein